MNSNCTDVSKLFFDDLKRYNLTNFRTLEKADLSESNPIVHKAFSSVVTRYFIFCEKHPEIADIDVVCEGKFVKELLDNRKHWVGSTNQRVVDVKASLQDGNVVLHNS